MKLKAIFLWLSGVPSCLLATTDTGAAAAAFNEAVADGGKVNGEQFDVVELYNHGKRTRRMVFRPNASHVIVHETFSPAVDAPEGASTAEPASKDEGTTPEELGDINASKAARELATERGIDLSLVVGTGVDGQITKSDVAKHQV